MLNIVQCIGSIEVWHYSFFRTPTYDPHVLQKLWKRWPLIQVLKIQCQIFDLIKGGSVSKLLHSSNWSYQLHIASPSFCFVLALLGNCLELCDKNGWPNSIGRTGTVTGGIPGWGRLREEETFFGSCWVWPLSWFVLPFPPSKQVNFQFRV